MHRLDIEIGMCENLARNFLLICETIKFLLSEEVMDTVYNGNFMSGLFFDLDFRGWNLFFQTFVTIFVLLILFFGLHFLFYILIFFECQKKKAKIKIQIKLENLSFKINLKGVLIKIYGFLI